MLMPCARLGCYDAKGDTAVAHGFRGVDSWERVPSRVPIGKSPSWSVEEMYLSRTLNDSSARVALASTAALASLRGCLGRQAKRMNGVKRV